MLTDQTTEYNILRFLKDLVLMMINNPIMDTHKPFPSFFIADLIQV